MAHEVAEDPCHCDAKVFTVLLDFTLIKEVQHSLLALCTEEHCTHYGNFTLSLLKTWFVYVDVCWGCNHLVAANVSTHIHLPNMSICLHHIFGWHSILYICVCFPVVFIFIFVNLSIYIIIIIAGGIQIRRLTWWTSNFIVSLVLFLIYGMNAMFSMEFMRHFGLTLLMTVVVFRPAN